MIKPNQPEPPADLSSENLLVCSLYGLFLKVQEIYTTDTFQYYYIIMYFYL